MKQISYVAILVKEIQYYIYIYIERERERERERENVFHKINNKKMEAQIRVGKKMKKVTNKSGLFFRVHKI